MAQKNIVATITIDGERYTYDQLKAKENKSELERGLIDIVKKYGERVLNQKNHSKKVA